LWKRNSEIQKSKTNQTDQSGGFKFFEMSLDDVIPAVDFTKDVGLNDGRYFHYGHFKKWVSLDPSRNRLLVIFPDKVAWESHGQPKSFDNDNPSEEEVYDFYDLLLFVHNDDEEEGGNSTKKRRTEKSDDGSNLFKP